MSNKFSGVKELRLTGRFVFDMTFITSAEAKCVEVENAAPNDLDWEEDDGILTIILTRKSPTQSVSQVVSGNIGGNVVQVVGNGNRISGHEVKQTQESVPAEDKPVVIKVGPGVAVALHCFSCNRSTIKVA